MKRIRASLLLTLAMAITTALLTTTTVYGREDVGKSPPSSKIVKATTVETVYHFDATATTLVATDVGIPGTSYAKMTCSISIHDATAAAINYSIPDPERSQAVHNDYYSERSSAWCVNVPRPPLVLPLNDQRCTRYGLSTRPVAPVGKVVISKSGESFARSRLS